MNSMRFYIAGIHCAKCVRRLEDLASSVPGLSRLRVEIGKNLAHVEVDPKVLLFSQVAGHILRLGYQPIPLEHGGKYEDARKLENRQELIRLAVAGICAANIMTFAFATYFGAGEWSLLFRWFSFALYLPVLTFVALPFYHGAWQSLKQRQVSIDLPMAIASLAGFIFSTAELIRGRTDIYYDSLSGFLFLILISRWIQKRMQRSFLRPQELHETLQLQRVRKVESLTWAWRPVEALVSGDRILIYGRETLPADAELLSSKAYFSLAWLSGEAKAKTFLKGAIIPAGARLLAGEAQLTIKRSLSETGFGKLLEEVRKFSLSKNRVVLSADKWGQWLLVSVFAVAIAFLILYWHVSPEQAVQRSLALIILACPCAMAFGAPLALAVSLRRAQRAGLIIRDANVFDKAHQIKTVFFDKTGTLTDTDLHYQGDPDQIPPVFQKIILSLENESLHPVAFAFRKVFVTKDRLPPADSLSEIPGVGVSGYVFGKYYELKKNTTASDEISCTLFEDEVARFKFTFEAQAKADSAETLHLLRKKGYRVVLLSGDQKDSVIKLADKLGFAKDDVFYSASPSEKAKIVAQTPNAMMVGDGINDSLAMIQADVGLAVSGGMETALKSADAYLAEDGIKGVAALLTTSQEAFSLIRQNLLISVAYNLTGGTLALLGYVNPLVAAILMPLSSGFILLTTWLRGRA
ncbi:MAG: heavy metal translocating P-type ATPase [Bdellovibrionales bacterium]